MNRLTIQQTMFVLFAAACCSLMIGCASSTPAKDTDDTFFEPLTSIERPSASKPTEEPRSERSEWIVRADSLQRILNEQIPRIDTLMQQIQLLQSSRVAALPDTAPAQKKEVIQPSLPAPREKRASAMSYDAALRVYESGKYQSAIGAFQELLRRGIDLDLEDNCLLWIGVSHFNLKRFERAASSFKQVIDRKGSDKKADALFMLGQTYEQLGNGRQAKTMFEALLKEFPTGELAPAARRKLTALGSTK